MSAFLASQLGRDAPDFVLPTARDEAWRYTALRGIDRAHAADDAASTRVVALVDAVAAPIRLVFVNGTLRADLSVLDASVVTDSAFESRGADVFARMAAALVPGGVSIALDGEVALVFVSAGEEQPLAAHLRLQLDVRSSGRVFVQHVGRSSSNVLTNVSLDAHLHPGAELDVVRLNECGPGTSIFERFSATLDERATLRHWSVDVGSDLSRHSIDVALAGNGSRFLSRGAFVKAGRQHADTQLSVDHVARDTSCDLRWRGIADERARGVFNGTIRVHAGADGTDAQLQNKNLLLSPHAEIDTRPVLEILADEVKASHGATVGELDETALFYLRSRGIPRDAARALLTSAFAHAPFADAPANARDAIARLLDRRVTA